MKQLFLISITVLNLHALDIYPWGKTNYEDRAEEILTSLRKNLAIEVYEDTVINELNLDGKQTEIESVMYMRNKEYRLFGVELGNNNNNNDGKSTNKVITPAERNKLLYDPYFLSKILEETCAILPIDYWTYEWCHRKSVRQFHIELQGINFKRNPDWSLGQFIRSTVVRESSNSKNASSPIVKMIEHFQNGQICHDNNDHRSTEVHIQCCEGTDLYLNNKEFIHANAYFSHQSSVPLPKATFNKISEPKLCHYHVVACTPLLCRDKPTLTPTDAESSNDELVDDMITSNPTRKLSRRKNPTTSEHNTKLVPKTNYVEVMKIMNATCLIKAEDWWTYEFCFNTGLRQVRYNLEHTIMPDGSLVQKQILVNQYILGLPPLGMYKNNTALDQSVSLGKGVGVASSALVSEREKEIFSLAGILTSVFRSRDQEPKHFTLEFTNGTPCDLHTENRSTLVEVHCGATKEIISIQEDSTCHYLLKVMTPSVCGLPDFSRKKLQTQRMILKPLQSDDDDDDDDVDNQKEEKVKLNRAKHSTEAASQPKERPKESPSQLHHHETMSDGNKLDDSTSTPIGLSNERHQSSSDGQEEGMLQTRKIMEAIHSSMVEEKKPVKEMKDDVKILDSKFGSSLDEIFQRDDQIEMVDVSMTGEQEDTHMVKVDRNEFDDAPSSNLLLGVEHDLTELNEDIIDENLDQMMDQSNSVKLDNELQPELTINDSDQDNKKELPEYDSKFETRRKRNFELNIENESQEELNVENEAEEDMKKKK